MTTELTTTKHDLAQCSDSEFALAQRKSQMLAASTIVPNTFQGNVANCCVALNMAERIGADVLSVMQSLYIVHGRPAWSASFLIACVNTCGRFDAMQYEFSGKEGTDGWGCTASATERDTGNRLTGTTITISLAKAEGWYGKKDSKWKTMPEQMLRYRAAAFWVRAFAPEIALGMHTADEAEDIGPQKRNPTRRPKTDSKARSEIVGSSVQSDEKVAEKTAEVGHHAKPWSELVAEQLDQSSTKSAVEAVYTEWVSKATSEPELLELESQCERKLKVIGKGQEFDENGLPVEVVPDGELFSTQKNVD